MFSIFLIISFFLLIPIVIHGKSIAFSLQFIILFIVSQQFFNIVFLNNGMINAYIYDQYTVVSVMLSCIMIFELILKGNLRIVNLTDLFLFISIFMLVVMYILKGGFLGETVMLSFGVIKSYFGYSFFFILTCLLYNNISKKDFLKLINLITIVVIVVNLLAIIINSPTFFDVHYELLRDGRSRVLISGYYLVLASVFYLMLYVSNRKLMFILLSVISAFLVIYMGQSRTLTLTVLAGYVACFIIQTNGYRRMLWCVSLLLIFVFLYISYFGSIVDSTIAEASSDAGNYIHRLQTVAFFSTKIDNFLLGGYLYNSNSDAAFNTGIYFLSDVGIYKEYYLFGVFGVLMVILLPILISKNKTVEVLPIHIVNLTSMIFVCYFSSMESFASTCVMYFIAQKALCKK